MRISDWSSDVCSSDLQRSSGANRSPIVGRAASSSAGAALATAFAISSAIASEAAQTSLEGWAKRAHTETLRVSEEASLRKSARLSTAYLAASRSEEHTSELQSLMRNSYAVFCL